MKLLIIIILAAGSYYFIIHKPKVDAYNKYISKSKTTSSSSTSQDFREFTNTSKSDYKGLSKPETINLAIKEARALQAQFNSKMKETSVNSGEAVKIMINTFLNKYVKALGRAYTASSGENKSALKFIKTYVVNWYQRISYFEVEIFKLVDMLEYGLNGNLNEMQATNRHALIELSKLLKEDNRYLSTFRNNFLASIKKYSISNPNIKQYAKDITNDVPNVVRNRQMVNQSLTNLVDKYYALNSYILRNNSNGQLTVANRGKWQALVRIANDIQAAESDFDRKLNIYYDSY